MSTINRRCETCACFNRLPEPQCRRKSPDLVIVPDVVPGKVQLHGTWPPTRPELWCWEYVPGAAAPALGVA